MDLVDRPSIQLDVGLDGLLLGLAAGAAERAVVSSLQRNPAE